MNIKFYSILSLIFFVIVSTSCKTASKLYEKGNYDEAVELAAKKLQKNPDDRKLKTTLQNAYRFAVNDHESRIRNLSGNNNELNWEWIHAEYTALQKLYAAIRNSPEIFENVNPTDYSTYITTYAEKAADTRYERGMRWMNRNDRQSFKNAYNEFNAALRYNPGDFSIKTKLDEAYQLAVLNIIVLPVDNFRYRHSSNNNYELRNFENDLLRKLQYHGGDRFVKFYNEWDARSRDIRPDHFIDFRFVTMNIGRVQDEQNSREVSKDVLIKETVYRPDSVVKEYKKVFAKIIITKRTMNSTGNLFMNIRDQNSRRLWSDDFRGTHNWITEFATFTGDERALSENDKQLINRPRNNPPDEDEIMRQIINDIDGNLFNRIRDFYNRN